MPASNRAALISKAQKVLAKHYTPVNQVERPVLEQLLYACCLENNRYEVADETFARLQESMFDWNEVRVTTIRELSELMKGNVDPTKAANQLKHTLHSVFESVYAFDLEILKKQNLGVSVKQLEGYRGVTPFAIAYVVQNSLGGHAIPLSEGALNALHYAGIATEAEAKAGKVPGLERAVPKTKGAEFSSILHQLGAELAASPAGEGGFGRLRDVVEAVVLLRLPQDLLPDYFVPSIQALRVDLRVFLELLGELLPAVARYICVLYICIHKHVHVHK